MSAQEVLGDTSPLLVHYTEVELRFGVALPTVLKRVSTNITSASGQQKTDNQGSQLQNSAVTIGIAAIHDSR